MSAKYSLLVFLIVALLLAISSVLTARKSQAQLEAYNYGENIPAAGSPGIRFAINDGR